jgi:hypothetical protein
MKTNPRIPATPVVIENISPKRKAALNALNDGVPLLILAIELLFSLRLFSIGENEAIALNLASRPFTTILAQFRYGIGTIAAPTFYLLWLHVWLFLSDGAQALLRVPSALFFIAGVYLLSRAAQFWGGELTANALLWVVSFWPYAFHYGSQTTVYSLAFLVIAALILAYLKFCAAPNRASWAVVCVLGLLLVYLSYFGWLVLIMLGVDYWFRNRPPSGQVSDTASSPATARLLGTAAIVVILYAPMWPAVLREVWDAARNHPSAKTFLLSAGYNLYALTASESVAPWLWRFGAPVAVAVAVGLVLCWVAVGWEVRRFLLFGGLLLVAMDFLGVLHADRLLLVAPLFLLPITIALCTDEKRFLRRTLTVALVIAVGVGWYGAYTRRYYATARFAEPWSGLSAETAGAVQQGAGLVSNSQSLFLYLTYDLAKAGSGFNGFLPEAPHNSQVWSADSWKAAGRPIQPYMIWMNAAGSSDSDSMGEAAASLDSQCGGRVARYLVRDPAYDWKRRFLPQLNATPWRIEIRQYLCGGTAPGPSATPVQPGAPVPGRAQ